MLTLLVCRIKSKIDLARACVFSNVVRDLALAFTSKLKSKRDFSHWSEWQSIFSVISVPVISNSARERTLSLPKKKIQQRDFLRCLKQRQKTELADEIFVDGVIRIFFSTQCQDPIAANSVSGTLKIKLSHGPHRGCQCATICCKGYAYK